MKSDEYDFTYDFTYGSDCSGMETPRIAMANTGLSCRQRFRSERCGSANKLFFAMYGTDGAEVFHEDIMQRDNNTMPHVDLYIFGAPCQAFAPGGKMEGSST